MVSGTLPTLIGWSQTSDGRVFRRRVRFFTAELGVALVFNIVIAGLATWFLSDWVAAGSGRVADALFEMAMATVGPLVGFVIPVTLSVRRRVRQGIVPAMVGSPLLPRNVVLRLAVLVATAAIMLALPAAWLLAVLAPQGSAFLLFKLGYAVIVGLTLTPFVLVAALRDR